MAQRMQVTLIDDLDGGAANETVAFGLDGVDYAIDLSASNAQALREALLLWIARGRRVPSTSTRQSGQGGGSGRTGRGSGRPGHGRATYSRSTRPTTDEAAQNQLVRDWARTHGWPFMPSSGHIGNAVRRAYDAAHPAAHPGEAGLPSRTGT